MIAASVYHLSLLAGVHKWLPAAEKAREALSTSGTTVATPGFSSSSGGMQTALSGLMHFTSTGLLTPVVNPEDFTSQGPQSPEGQGFVVEMQAAWNAWVQGGSKGANSAMGLTLWRTRSVWASSVLAALAAGVLLLW